MFRFKMKKKRSKKLPPVAKPKPKPSYMEVEAKLFNELNNCPEPKKSKFKDKAPKIKSNPGVKLPIDDAMKDWLKSRGY
jgi:hypothetical protein